MTQYTEEDKTRAWQLDSAGASSLEDFYDTLEGETPDAADSEAAEALAAVIDFCFRKAPNTRGANPAEELRERIASGYRQFASLVLLIRPQALGPAANGLRLAEALGCSRAIISRNMLGLSEVMGGFKGSGMRSDSARETYRHTGKKSSKGSPCRKPGTPGDDTFVDTATVDRDAETIARAVSAFFDGRQWTQREKHVLRLHGLLSDGDKLTSAGVAALDAASPSAESL